MIELMLQNELTLISQADWKNICCAIFGIIQILAIDVNQKHVMTAMTYIDDGL